MTSRSLDGARMWVVSTDAAGEVNRETTFEFTQTGQVVSARYTGGAIRLGYLVGVRDSERIEFRYAQVDDAGRVDGGHSTAELTLLEDGRYRLVEHFEWESRVGRGTNVFEEEPSAISHQPSAQTADHERPNTNGAVCADG